MKWLVLIHHNNDYLTRPAQDREKEHSIMNWGGHHETAN